MPTEEDTADKARSGSFDLDRAYAVVTPDDNRRLYADWASTYDEGFLASHGYVYHRSVVDAFLRRDRQAGPVLDVGCGTGVVGEELRRRGVAEIDGIDLSPEMLTVAATKRAEPGDAVYRSLIPADLTTRIGIADASYAGIVSAGTFTHGHLGPEPLRELVRIARPGAVLAIGINADHFEASGFAAWFDQATSSGLINHLEIVESPVYDVARYEGSDVAAHGSTMSSVAVFLRSRPG